MMPLFFYFGNHHPAYALSLGASLLLFLPALGYFPALGYDAFSGDAVLQRF